MRLPNNAPKQPAMQMPIVVIKFSSLLGMIYKTPFIANTIIKVIKTMARITFHALLISVPLSSFTSNVKPFHAKKTDAQRTIIPPISRL